MVTTASSVKGALVCEAARSPPVGKLHVGMPVSGAVGRGRVTPVIPVLVSVHSAWLLCVKHAVKGNIMFVPLLHSVDFFSGDSMNVSSAWEQMQTFT